MKTIHEDILIWIAHPYSESDRANLMDMITKCEIENINCGSCNQEADCTRCIRNEYLSDLYEEKLTLEEQAIKTCIDVYKQRGAMNFDAYERVYVIGKALAEQINKGE